MEIDGVIEGRNDCRVRVEYRVFRDESIFLKLESRSRGNVAAILKSAKSGVFLAESRTIDVNTHTEGKSVAQSSHSIPPPPNKGLVEATLKNRFRPVFFPLATTSSVWVIGPTVVVLTYSLWEIQSSIFSLPSVVRSVFCRNF